MLRDEHGKPSSTRVGGLLLLALLVASVISDVWLFADVSDKVYDVLMTLILALVGGMTVRGATKTVATRPPQIEPEE